MNKKIDQKPKVFIGSSTEGLEVARAIQYQLNDVARAVLWNEGIFELTRNYLESLLKATHEFDYAVVVFRADDELTSRGAMSPVTRGNVVFELGLFLGSLGIDRTFVAYDKSRRPDVISDLEGVTFAPFDSSGNTDILSAVGPACFMIRQVLKRHVGSHEPSRILFLGSNPTDTMHLSLDREVRAIATGIRNLQQRGRVSFVQHWALQVEELDSVLEEHSPNFVHIACHSDGESGLILEGATGLSAVVAPSVVAKILTLFSDSIRCVLFTSGTSDTIATSLIEKIACVISLENRISDEGVITFTSAFYYSLGSGQAVQRAFEVACTRLAATGQEGEPKLYAKPGSAEILTL